MTTGEALEIVKNYGESWGYPGMLETLEGMLEANHRDELYFEEKKAFRIVWNEFSRMFQPA